MTTPRAPRLAELPPWPAIERQARLTALQVTHAWCGRAQHSDTVWWLALCRLAGLEQAAAKLADAAGALANEARRKNGHFRRG